ncbi:MAG: flavodoxin family protein [Anaerovoracaceae bacterium]|jgi:multimeric flavodoxin WrbA
MKVLLINGSPHKNGCTFTALQEVAGSLNGYGIETELYHIGSGAVQGCTGCYHCSKTGEGCIFKGDQVEEILGIMENSHGLIVGSPVYYSAPNGSLMALLDRCFYSGGDVFAYKPAAALVSARRAGTTAALDCLYKYFANKGMPIVTSRYWNMVHGNKPDEVRQDLEGMQIMRALGDNMAWMLKSIEAGRDAGIQIPPLEKRVSTSFIR